MQQAAAFVLHTFLSHTEQISDGPTADPSVASISQHERQVCEGKTFNQANNCTQLTLISSSGRQTISLTVQLLQDREREPECNTAGCKFTVTTSFPPSEQRVESANVRVEVCQLTARTRMVPGDTFTSALEKKTITLLDNVYFIQSFHIIEYIQHVESTIYAPTNG